MNLDFVEIPNQTILASAKTYLLSAELLEKQNEQLELGAILCSSLSIELLLKSLLSKSFPKNIEKISEGSWFYTGVTHKAKSGHSYAALFNALEPTFQNYLSSSYGSNDSHDSLISMLKHFDGTFVCWRYGFETTGKSINITHLLKLNRKLYELISNLKISSYSSV